MMSDYRIEKDSLGEVHVPSDALYGAQTQRAIDNFAIGDVAMPRRFIQALGMIKKSAAQANHALSILSEEKAKAIDEAADQVVAGDLDEHFPVSIYQTGSGTSSNMNANEVIAYVANRILEKGSSGDQRIHPNDDVNMSQSSNDVIPTAMHLSAALAIREELVPAMEALRDELERKANEFDDVVKSGRTHLMDATPVRMGQEFSGYASQISHALDRLKWAQSELSELALGGTATGTGINCPVGFAEKAIASINELTGLSFTEAENHFEAQAAKDGIVMVSGILNTLAVSLLKIANDIRHLSSGPTSGLAEIRLPAVQPGSSIMPGKVNPVMSEALMMVSARVMGHHTTITVAGQHGNFQLNVMMPVMAHALLESIGLLADGCETFRKKCLEGIEADRERCRELLELNPAIATALNSVLGYDQASEVAKKAAKEKKSIRTVIEEMGLLDGHDLDAVLNVENMTRPGIPDA